MSESKNDNVVRQWTGKEASPFVAHWCYDGAWDYYPPHDPSKILVGDIFCLNDAEHPPTPPDALPTDSLEGLI